MRFMVMHKMTEELEKGLPPDPELVARVDELIGEAARDNIFLSGEGLRPSAERVHIVYKNGERRITDGPFTEAKELVGGFALMRVGSREEALAWCDKLAAAAGDLELFLGPVVEAWDLGMMPKPEHAPQRFLALHKMDARSEAGAPPDPQLMARMGALVAEMKEAGVLLATDGLASTKYGARIRFEGGKHKVIDGPFTESKELIAGYAILELPSKAAAIEWGIRFGEIVKVNEVEVRQFPAC